jgi:hypothetical protein
VKEKVDKLDFIQIKFFFVKDNVSLKRQTGYTVEGKFVQTHF